jgi:hypothetical protein
LRRRAPAVARASVVGSADDHEAARIRPTPPPLTSLCRRGDAYRPRRPSLVAPATECEARAKFLPNSCPDLEARSSAGCVFA